MRTAYLTPLYLSVSWVLTVSYQLFTETAVKSLADYVAFFSPALAVWVNDNVNLIVFIYAFTWIFVLSSVIPSLLLGKKRSVLVQYVVCLSLAVLALAIPNLLTAYGGVEMEQLFTAATFLSNPVIAGLYLAVPYIVMLALDARSNMQAKKRLQPLPEAGTVPV